VATHYLEHQDGSIAFDDSGKGTLVICVPSMGDLRGEYRFLAPKLRDNGLRAVTMDVRGHGETTTFWGDYSVAAIGSDMVALIDYMRAGPAVIVGTSMAAGAAVWAAAEAADLVQALVLVDPFVRGEGTWWSNLLFSVMLTRPWGPSMWMRYYAMLYPSRKPADYAQYSAALRANLEQPGRLEALVEMIRASKHSSEERLAKVRAPTLVIMGGKDPDFKKPEAEAQWVANSLNGRYEMIHEAGHYPHAEMPDQFAALVLPFLHGLSRANERAMAA
jgi:pimeloyl-ACP methyl ester carboxylesterase